MRPKHLVTGLFVFGVGLFFMLKNTLYVVEFIKGGAQPLFVVLGLVAACAAIINSNKTQRIVNLCVAIILLLIGCYGVYDEFYATKDFISGLLPPLLILTGLVALIHGILKVK